MAKYVQPNFIVDSSAAFLRNATFDSSVYLQGVTHINAPNAVSAGTPYAMVLETGAGTDLEVKSKQLGTMAFETATDYETKANIDSSLADIWTDIGNLETSVGALDTLTQNLDTSIGALDTLTQTHTTEIANLETSVGALDILTQLHEASLGNLDTYINYLETSVGTLDILTQNLETSVGALDIVTQNLDASLDLYVEKGGDTMTGILIFDNLGFTLDSVTIATIDTSVEGLGAGSDTALPTSGLVKSYVDAQITSGVEAWNGLTETGASIGLGGTLAAATTITTSTTNTLTIDGLLPSSDGTPEALVMDTSHGVLKYRTLGTMAWEASLLYVPKTHLDSSLADIWTELGVLDTSIGQLDTQIQTNVTDITNLETSVGVIDVSLTQLNTGISNNATSITNLETSVGVLDILTQNIETSVGALDTLTQTHTTDITNLETSVGVHDVCIGQLDAARGNMDASLDLYLPLAGGTLTGDLILSGGTTDLVVDGSAIFNGITAFKDDVYFDGSAYFTGVETIDVSAGFIHLNTGLSGAPPANLQSGVIVGRGTSDPYAFVYDETTQTFCIGITSSSDGLHYDDASTQAVATRQDSPTSNGVAYWNDALNRIDVSPGFTFAAGLVTIDGSLKTTGLLATGLAASGAELTSAMVLPSGEIVTRELTSAAVTSPANLTISGPLSISGGTGAVLATTDISIIKASATDDGYLSSTDWSDFNQKIDDVSTVNGVVGGHEVYSGEAGDVAYIKKIVAGAGATIISDSSTVTISVTGAAGYVSKYSNTFDGTAYDSSTILAAEHGLGVGPLQVTVYDTSGIVYTDVANAANGDITLSWSPGSLSATCKFVIMG